MTWINQTVPKLQDWEAKKRLQEIQKREPDVGNYLYESGRCAIAHAFGTPVADPDDPEDTMRLSQDLRLLVALAEYAVEHEFGVKSAATIRNEHLYQLAGFHQLLGPKIAKKLKAKQPVELADIPELPRLTLKATRDSAVAEHVSFVATPFGVADGCLGLQVSSPDGLVVWRLVLDFPGEGLCFDPYADTAYFDDGSARAVELVLISLSIKEILLRNGRLEIWNADSGKCLGKTDAFIGRNIDLRGTLQNHARLRDAYETQLWMRISPVADACDI